MTTYNKVSLLEMRKYFSLLLVTALTISSSLGCSSNVTNDTENEISNPQETETIKVFYNDPYQFTSPPDTCESPICLSLLELIDNSESSIDFAVYGMRNQTDILESLIKAKERGVSVRGIIDRDSENINYYSSTESWVSLLGNIKDDFLSEEEASFKQYEDKCPRPEGFKGPLQCLAYDLGDSWIIAEHVSVENFADPTVNSASNKIMHNKFFIIDSRKVWTGSTNISDTGTGGYNANVAAVIDSREVAITYRHEFEQMLNGSYHQTKISNGIERVDLGNAKLSIWFSPQDNAMEDGVIPVLAEAKSHIDVSIFYLTHKDVAAELISAHKRGVLVRVIVDATSATNGYTKHELIRLAGIPVKVENWGGKMHMKSASIDDEYLILGSMNWTIAGADKNDENTIIIKSSKLAAEHSENFEQLWNGIPEKWEQPGQRPSPESVDSGSACFDGVDNDFDGKSDEDDPGCSSGEQLPLLPPNRILQKTNSPSIPQGYKLYPSLGSNGDCNPNYKGVCLPNSNFDILNCTQIATKDFLVTREDTFKLDGNNDGEACETWSP